jgi:hypothetical protein
MALAALPRPAAAATNALVAFNLTVYGPAPSGDTLAVFLEAPASEGSGQIFVFCAPLSSPGPNPAGPCQGGGKTYTISLSFPSGTQGFYQFQDVGPSGRLIVLEQGIFTAPAVPEVVVLTIFATFGPPPTPQHQCGCGTGPGFGPPLPNTAVAEPVADGRETVLPALGILMVLLAAAMSARRRRAELPPRVSA